VVRVLLVVRNGEMLVHGCSLRSRPLLVRTPRSAYTRVVTPTSPVRHHKPRRPQTRVPPKARLSWSLPWAVSSVGRAPARQAGGHWFEPSTAHKKRPANAGLLVSCTR